MKTLLIIDGKKALKRFAVNLMYYTINKSRHLHKYMIMEKVAFIHIFTFLAKAVNCTCLETLYLQISYHKDTKRILIPNRIVSST